MSQDSKPLVDKVTELFSIKDFTTENDALVEGRSGAKHKFDLIVSSKQGKKAKLAVLNKLSQDTIKDVMMFNAFAEDCGIQLKVLSVDRELNDPEINLLNTYHISVIDNRSTEVVNLRPVIFGLTELDRMVNGSVKKGNVYMISGNVGSGKTVLSTHFLVQGARLGEKGAIILTDSKREQYVENSQAMFPDFADFYKNGTIEVIELSSETQKLRREVLRNRKNSYRYVTRLADEIRDTVKGSRIQRLVIDPITPVLMDDEDIANQMFRSLGIPQCTTLVTSGVRGSNLSFYGFEEYYASGIILLETDFGASDTKRATIVKMRGGGFIPGTLYFQISRTGVTEGQDNKLLDVLPYEKMNTPE